MEGPRFSYVSTVEAQIADRRESNGRGKSSQPAGLPVWEGFYKVKTWVTLATHYACFALTLATNLPPFVINIDDSKLLTPFLDISIKAGSVGFSLKFSVTRHGYRRRLLRPTLGSVAIILID
ncbi:hypothetical protein AVEN_226242-1 [Araneus ventricosus]|uniref:Uncharacterized protein n=1 Tax=Araneus ventricosus TaxID=182803 RepID=A0A4Y2TW62_ARAVE|nr:hypothetical protein AVEN_226242-1 [Araneus ventricosus]